MTDSGSVVQLEGVLVTVNPKQFNFAPENYRVTRWDRIKSNFWTLVWRLWPFRPVVF